ncbi:family 43 glycosylhydrolase [Rhodanobacter glycinis]|uniref:Family 43 glycosylhydrolase n=1 Tax=Rhodanobacter glycinis TaxID=582702 RepID=A0A5B9DY59_9GAMM|nr:glycoside hydrolase family 43 protein [Rhodanobacter glycinis]QEE23655.1 family 43 glycosylhydrolase [Rhodanobacter glycinis]
MHLPVFFLKQPRFRGGQVRVRRLVWRQRLSVAIWMIVALAVALPTVAAARAGGTFTNPLFAGGDPWVTRVDGVYYYSASNCGAADICIKRSRSLSGLASAAWIGVWNHTSANAPNAHEIWAPELHHINGRWYIYYAADDGNNDHHRLYVLEADRPTGPFREADTGHPHGRLVESSGNWAIDPDVFIDANGKLDLTWSCTDYPDSRFPQRVCLARMRDPLHVAGATVPLSTPTEPWETRGKPIQEGPVGYTRNGRTYITYSASASWIPDDYAVGLLTLAPGASPLRPSDWTKSGPIFDHHGTVYGPGSVVFVASPDMSQWWNVYHAIERLDCNPAYHCRDIRMQPMHFNAEGAPILGIPVEAGVPLSLPSGDRLGGHGA